jgi:hypothetical protein
MSARTRPITTTEGTRPRSRSVKPHWPSAGP